MKTLLRRAILLAAILSGFGSLAFGQQPITVPLALVNIGDNAGSPDYKLGIWVGLGGGAPQLYEFDTGGKGLWASYEKTENLDAGVNQWWGSFEDLGHDISNVYSSGYTYHAKMVSSSVQIYGNVYSPGSGNSPGTLATQSPGGLDIAQIDSAHKDGSPSSGSEWKASVKAGQPALQTQFFGDFGVSLEIKADGSKELFSVLPQLIPSGLTNGFIVSAGARGNTAPQVQFGLTGSDLASFPIQFDISAAYEGQYDGINTFAEELFTAMVKWSLADGSQTTQEVPIVLDTGAPVTSVHEYDDFLKVDPAFFQVTHDGGKEFKPDIFFEALAGEWQFLINQTGDQPNIDKISIRSGDLGYVNTGILAFNTYDVLFDLDNKILAFRPATVPEPSALFLVSGGLFALGSLLRRK